MALLCSGDSWLQAGGSTNHRRGIRRNPLLFVVALQDGYVNPSDECYICIRFAQYDKI